jgi:flagellar basal body-associated protein FliL
MSEETNVPESDGTWSGLRKTIIGLLTTIVTAGGVWITTHLFGGQSEDDEKPKTEVAAPAPVIVNVQQNQENTQKQQNNGGTTTIIKEKTIEKAAPTPVKPKEEEPW